MLSIHGRTVELYESKDFAHRARFESGQEERVALRYTAAPKAAQAQQADGRRRWAHARDRANREFTAIIDDALKRAAKQQSFDAVRRNASSWLDRWSVSAYEHGLRAAGLSARAMGPSDVKWLDTAWRKTEWGFLANFLHQIQREMCSAPRARHRARMYANSLDSVFYAALVAAFPTIGTTIHWILGNSEHCDDCIGLARRTYTKDTLPTTPRAGRTRCLSFCRCHLVVSYVPVAVKLGGKPRPHTAAVEAVLTDDVWITEHGVEVSGPLAIFIASELGTSAETEPAS